MLDSLRTLLLNEPTVRDETRKQIQVLSSYNKKRKSNHQHFEENVCDEINSTGSFLSDLSLTQSGDDLLDPKPSTAANKKWKKHRPSQENSGALNVSGKRGRSSLDQRRSARSKFSFKSIKLEIFNVPFVFRKLGRVRTNRQDRHTD